MKCSKCGSKDIDFQEAGGQSICVNCGTVLEESTIVSSIEFQARKLNEFCFYFLLITFYIFILSTVGIWGQITRNWSICCCELYQGKSKNIYF